MNFLTLLHLSDLHYHPARKNDINIVLEALIRDLRDLKQTGLSPDVVIFSGDLIHSGDDGYSERDSHYDEARRLFVDRIIDELNLNSDCFLICAGNHDVQRSKVDQDKFNEAGLRQLLVDRNTVNELIHTIDTQNAGLSRLRHFEKFRQSLNSGRKR